MLAITTRAIGLCLAAIASLFYVPFPADAGEVAVDCTTLAQWTKRPAPPQVNQVHVFCGEWKHNTPRGFHSRPGGLDPETVARFTVTQPANAQGVYGGSRSYTGHPQPPKFSTMFPDIGNAYRLYLSAEGALIEDLVDPTSAPPRVPLEELETAVRAWLQAIG